MAEEIRRSGRATKGQHTKNIDAPETPVPSTKRGAKGKGSKAKQPVNEPSPPQDDNEADDIIRCICGYVEEDEDDERVMVVCDNCEAWQHNECMEISERPEELPDQYFCELCKPENHKELLAKVARGEKPWEERAREREREEAEKKGRKRKGKKGKKGRPSEAKKEEPKSNGAIAVPAAAVPPKEPVAPETPKVEAGQKRKLVEEVASAPRQIEPPQFQVPDKQQQPQHKVRKVSSPVDIKAPPLPQYPRRKDAMVVPPSPRRMSTSTVVLQTELVESVDDLQSEPRKRIAVALVKLFVDQTKQAQKQGSFKLPPGQSADEFGNKIGLAVEYAVYLNFWGNSPEPSTQYGDKFRTINHNVKNNLELRDRLLNGSLSPNELSKMTSQDMASKELQEKTAEMKKDAEKQHIIQQEEGPRIRRTHKGEELVGDDTHMTMGSDSVFAPAPVRRRESQLDPNAPKPESPPASTPVSPVAVELPENVGQQTAPVPAPVSQPLTLDTNARPPPVERQSSSAFDIQNVWSSVSGPTTTDGQNQQAPQRHDGQQQPVQTDPEIDHLLKDEEPEEEEPYSPIDYAANPDAPVWSGKMVMMNVAGFGGTGKFVAGFNLSSKFRWSDLVPSNLVIEGRIDIDRASEYICGLRFSNTTDVTVIAITPIDDEKARAEFDKLFTYFTERKRYGVVSTQGNSVVKDTYLVPLEAGAEKKPDFIELLEVCTIEDPTPERMLLLTMVIRSNPDAPSAQATPHVDGAMVASPGTPAQAMHQNSSYPAHQTPVAPQQSPMPGHPYGTPQGHMPPYNNGSPPQPQQGFMPPPQPQQPYQQSPYQNPPVGMEAAREALGELANTHSVQELIKEAPTTSVGEFGAVRRVLESVPATQNNFHMMKEMLAIQYNQNQSTPGGT